MQLKLFFYTGNEVTALACRSLSLAQSLGEKCQNMNLSASSDEEGENSGAGHSHDVAESKEGKTLSSSLPSASLSSHTRNRDVDRAGLLL